MANLSDTMNGSHVLCDDLLGLEIHKLVLVFAQIAVHAPVLDHHHTTAETS